MSTAGRKIHGVRLEEHERKMLREMACGGRGSKERRRRAHILRPADEDRQGGARSDADIADIPGAGTARPAGCAGNASRMVWKRHSSAGSR